MVIVEERASLKLLTASKVIAMEPVISPTAALKIESSTFTIIHIMLVLIISFILLTALFFALIFLPSVLFLRRTRYQLAYGITHGRKTLLIFCHYISFI